MLTFDEARHLYTFGGETVPGVTSILRPLVDFGRVPRDVLDAKADLGRRVHFACQLHDENDLDEASVEADVAPYLAAYRRFLAESGATVLENEKQVYEPTLRYAGTLDRVMLVSGLRWLVDIKTSIALPNSVGAQTSAYLRALRDPQVTRRGALRLRPDGSYRLDPLTEPDDFSVFMACLTIYRWQERSGYAPAEH